MKGRRREVNPSMIRLLESPYLAEGDISKSAPVPATKKPLSTDAIIGGNGSGTVIAVNHSGNLLRRTMPLHRIRQNSGTC